MVVVMCKKTGIKHEYQNWDEACVPGGPGGVPPASCDRHRRHGRACEVRAVGAGLKLVKVHVLNLAGLRNIVPKWYCHVTSVAGARLSSAWLSFCSLATIGGLERSQATGLVAPI